MDWTETLDGYCERLGPGFWAEPVNAVTNAAFIAAAAVAVAIAAREGRRDAAIPVLVAILVAIGVGSFLFHTVATRWALLADVVPIQLFIVAYFALAMRRFAAMPWWGAALSTAAFMVFSVFAGGLLGRVAGEALNGSEGYVPPLVALFAVGIVLRAARRRAAGGALVLAAAIFAVSLAFRTVDMAVCEDFPLGTHFVWHTLNGVLLGVLVVAMIRHGAPRRA